MRILALLLFCEIRMLAAQASPQPADCLLNLGPITYPPYEWGAHESGGLLADVRVSPDGSAEILKTCDLAANWMSDFALQIRRSMASSSFDTRCAGRTLKIRFLFTIAGEPSPKREAAIASASQNFVLIVARPPSPLCGTSAGSDEEAEALHGQAEFLLNRRNYSEAVACAEEAIRWKPAADPYVIKGVAFGKLGRPRDAIAAYDQAERLDASNQHVHFDRGNAYGDLGQFDRALQDFTTAIDHVKEPYKAYGARGNVYLKLRKFDLALRDHSKAIELNPNDPHGYIGRGHAYAELGESQKALDDYRVAIAKDPSDPIPFNNRANTWIGLGKYEEAIRDAKEAVRLNPQYFEADFNLGLALGMAKRFPEAVTAFTEAVWLKPDNAAVYLLRALARKEMGDSAGEKSDREQAVRLGNSDSAAESFDLFGLKEMVEVHLAGGRIEQALSLLQAEVDRAPGRADFRLALANTCTRVGQLDRAMGEFRQLLDTADPSLSGDLYLRLGETYRRKGDLDSAVEALQKARERMPRNAQAVMTLALALDGAGKQAQAIEAYEACLRLQPDQPVALNNLAYLLATSGGDLDRALIYAQRSLELLPSQPQTLDTLAWVYLKKKLPESAREIWKDLIGKQPDNPTYRYHLALALVQTGDRENALTQLREALARYPSTGETQEIQVLIGNLSQEVPRSGPTMKKK